MRRRPRRRWKIGSRGEFERIAQFLKPFKRGRGVVVGPGDDCAVLKPSRQELCVTTDQVVQGVHFLRPGFSWEEIGYKALAVNLSDLAAMGAAPRWFVCALACPKDLPDAAVPKMARGMAGLATQAKIALVGGNFTSASELSLTLTVAGEVPKGRALLRSGGRSGDLLYVSGWLGDARLGLHLLQHASAASPRGAYAEAIRRQKRPVPRLALGRLARRFASAAIDLSDGLSQDLGHLCKLSGVGADLHLEALPRSPALRAAALEDASVLGYPLFGGEDYELLLAVPPARARAFERACAKGGHPLFQVGALFRGRGVFGVDALGARHPLRGGFDHFAPAASSR